MRWVLVLAAMPGMAMANAPTPADRAKAAETECLIAGAAALPKAPGLVIQSQKATRLPLTGNPDPMSGPMSFAVEYRVEALGRNADYFAVCYIAENEAASLSVMTARGLIENTRRP